MDKPCNLRTNRDITASSAAGSALLSEDRHNQFTIARLSIRSRGWRAASRRRALAGPSGFRWPCSQLRKVPGLMPRDAANSAWLMPIMLRKAVIPRVNATALLLPNQSGKLTSTDWAITNPNYHVHGAALYGRCSLDSGASMAHSQDSANVRLVATWSTSQRSDRAGSPSPHDPCPVVACGRWSGRAKPVGFVAFSPIHRVLAQLRTTAR